MQGLSDWLYLDPVRDPETRLTPRQSLDIGARPPPFIREGRRCGGSLQLGSEATGEEALRPEKENRKVGFCFTMYPLAERMGFSHG